MPARNAQPGVTAVTKFAIALLFAILAMAPLLIAQVEAQEARDGNWRGDLRRARARLNARAGRLGRRLGPGLLHPARRDPVRTRGDARPRRTGLN
jgi:hypothetical protein